MNQWQTHVEYEEVVRYHMLKKGVRLKAVLVDDGMPRHEPKDQEEAALTCVETYQYRAGSEPLRSRLSGLPVLHIAAINVVLGDALSGLLASDEFRTPSLSRGGYGQANKYVFSHL